MASRKLGAGRYNWRNCHIGLNLELARQSAFTPHIVL